MTVDKKLACLGFKCVSARPLITISTFSFDEIDLLSIRDMAPVLFDTSEGLHLLSLTWNCEEHDYAERVAKIINAARAEMTGHSFVVLASTEFEAMKLQQTNVVNILANSAIFVDEMSWHANRSPSTIVKFDACYVARLSRIKRHELAANIDQLSLVFGDMDLEREAEVRGMLSNATFLNRPKPEHDYSYFSTEATRKALHESSVALCLSASEGFSRTSIEALLCGVPIVSTPSIGGRDRYYHPAYATIAEPTPQAIANAVSDLKTRNVAPQAIRSHVGTLIDFDRRCFITALNKLVKQMFQSSAPLLTFEEFRNSIHDFHMQTHFAADIKALQEAAGLS